MKKALKRSLSFLLAITIIFGSAYVGLTEVDFDNLFAVRAKAATSGTTGDCTWSLKGTVLTISGNGAMENYSSTSSVLSSWGFGITEVIIKDGVTSIGSYAFSGCTSLTSITIPDSVTSIGYFAFRYCTSLTSITIPDSVKSIGDSAFYNCTSLTSITIPDSVKSIGDSAFYDCTSLASITIPDSVTSIGSNAFYNCTNLNAVYVTDISAWCGINFHYAASNPLYYAKKLYLNGVLVTDLVIPNSVTSIGNWAFYNCTSLTTITFPNSVTSIGKCAFEYCTSLTSITIPESVTSIGSAAFGNCISLTSITIPNSVTSIGYFVFEDCTSLTSITIPDSVTTIGDYAFSGCTSLTSVTIPDSVTNVGSSAFSGCTSLTSITIPDSVTSIGWRAFEYCTSLTSITIPDSVTSIDGGAFYDCTSLTSITIPDSVTSIGSSTFRGCLNLTSINIPDSVTSIGNYAFYNCISLTSITIPDSVTSIGNYAFSNCTNLTSITIPDSVTSIGEYAFFDCTNLEKICWNAKSVTDFNSSSNVFCKAGTAGSGIDVVFGDTVEKIPAYLFYETTSSYSPKVTSVTIGENVTSIGNCAFCNLIRLEKICWNAKSVTDFKSSSDVFCKAGTAGSGIDVVWGDTVESIPAYLFHQTISSSSPKLTSVTIPDTVTRIGEYSFYNCESLTSVTIPDSVTSIGDYAFEYCTKINAVYITDIAKWCGISFSNYSSNPLYYAENLYLNGELVTKLVIPDSVTSIGEYAFYNCKSLASVTIGNGVTSIGDCDFGYCTGLTSVTIPDSVTSIGDYAFYGCKSLTSITIPDSVTSIARCTFRNCESLAAISVDEDNETYCSVDGVLFDKTKTTLVKYPEGKPNTSYIIPDGVTSIGSEAFAFRRNLTSITIPDSVTSIGNYCCCEIPGACRSFDEIKTSCNSYASKYFYKNILNLSHNTLTDWVIDSYATLYEPGSKHSTCLICGDTVTEAIPQLKTETPKVKAINTIAGMKVTWNAVDGAVKYALYKRLGTANSWTYVTTTTGTSYADNNTPLAGSYYVYTVKAYNSADMASDYIKANCASVQRVVAPVTKAVNKLNGINVTWNKVEGANKYVVLRRIGTESTWKTLCTTTDASFLDNNVTPGIYYIYSIRAVNNTGYSEYDVNKRVTIQRVVAPHTYATNTPKGINVTWNKVAGANKYIVLRRLGTGSVWETICTTTGSSFLDENVTAGVYYLYSIRAVNNMGHSEYDVNKRVTIKRAAYKPATPTVVATNETYGVYIKWSYIKEATKYNVYRSVGNSNNFVLLGTTTNTWFYDENVYNGTNYVYAVRAINDKNISALDTNKTAKIKPVTAPTAMATNHINGVQVKWYSVTGAAQYSVFRRTAGTNTWVFIGTTTGTSLIDKGVKNGTYYEYSIRAINSTGYSAFNYRKTDNIQPITAPTAKVMNKSGSVQVSWNNIANANSYNVYRQISGSSTWVCVGQTKNTSFVDTGVIRGKTYTYSIRAINGTGYSAYDSSKCAVIKYS